MTGPCTIDYGEIYLVALSSKSLARKVTQLASLSPMIHSNKPISIPTDVVEYMYSIKNSASDDQQWRSPCIKLCHRPPCTDVKTAILGDNLKVSTFNSE